MFVWEVGPATYLRYLRSHWRVLSRTAQDAATDDLSFLLNKANTSYCISLCIIAAKLSVKLLWSNAEIVCHELIVMTRVAGDIQSSSRRNSGGRQAVLKPLIYQQWSKCYQQINIGLFIH